jgi:predicted DNA-binding protein (UPF0251 family)
MYSSLTYSNIKGTSNTINLDSVVVVTGPNESGKSAAATALQLATTGKCELGAQAASQAKLISGQAAMIAAWGKGIEASWSLRSGKKGWEDPGTQGGLPATLDDFWDLTGIERLKLIAPDGALASIESEISSLEAKRKELKTIIDASAPIPPDAYDGEPISVLENKIRELEQKLYDSRRSQEQLARRNQVEQSIATTKASIGSSKAEHANAIIMLAELEAEYDKVYKELAIYQEESAKEPKIVKSARERGVTLKAAIADTMGLVAEAIRHAGGQPDAAVDRVVQCVPEYDPLPIRHPIYDGPIAAYKGQQLGSVAAPMRQAISTTRKFIENLTERIESNERYVNTSLPEVCSEPMSVDEMIATQAEIGSLKQLIAKAGEWSAYEATVSRQMEARGNAFVEFETVGAELNKAKEKLTDAVQKLKGPIEVKANEFLSRARQPQLYIDVRQTGRGWSLDVSIGDIALEALARSKSIMYGVCLLAAIHEVSSARSPVLLVECAELDPSNFERLIEAMQMKKKGNVILEHWSKPKVDACIIDLSSGILV